MPQITAFVEYILKNKVNNLFDFCLFQYYN